MTPARRNVAGAALLSLALSGCGSNGLEAAGDDQGFAACMRRADHPVADSGDWSTAKQRRVMSRAATQRCALDELDDKQLADVMGSAFDGASGGQSMAALRTFIGGQSVSALSTAHDVGRLLAAQDGSKDSSSDDEDAFDQAMRAERPQWLLTVAVYRRANGAVPGLPEWVAAHGGDATGSVIIDFIQDGEDRGSRAYVKLKQLRDEIDRTRDGS